jgi:hypothetical protein
MNILNKTILASASLLLTATPAFADDPAKLFSGSVSFGSILDRGMQIAFYLAGGVCVVFIIMGGYMWMISAGDPSKVKQAQGTLTWAVIGLVIILLAVVILKVITTFIGA